MISGSAATSGSTETRTSLSYISDLITGATAKGSYRVFVGNEFIDSSMADTLVTTYGYTVTPFNSFNGTYNDYIISWEPPA